ncbi:MAG: 16S rRNA processing protein RimM [Terriglobia bacterium]|nr:MAG: 16S rRNA processing protein RimM [Terriglobia bacterium]
MEPPLYAGNSRVNSPEGEWVTVAVVGRTRGNRGEVFALPLSSNPERYQNLRQVYLFGSGERHEVESAWFHDTSLILKFRGIDNISEAEKLRGAEVRVPIGERTALEPGEFFQSDLMGCEIVEQRSGESLGRVVDWEDAGGSGLLVLDNGTLIPFARSICVEIDPAAGRIIVDLPEGLKNLNPA